MKFKCCIAVLLLKHPISLTFLSTCNKNDPKHKKGWYKIENRCQKQTMGLGWQQHTAAFLLGEEDTIYLDTVYFNHKAVIQKPLVPLSSSKLSVSVFVEDYLKRGKKQNFMQYIQHAMQYVLEAKTNKNVMGKNYYG